MSSALVHIYPRFREPSEYSNNNNDCNKITSKTLQLYDINLYPAKVENVVSS